MSKPHAPQIVVISGTTSGIGAALAELYRAAGDTVIGLARRESSPTGIAVDVTDRAAVRAAVDSVAQRYGRIDVVIANAGGGLSGATELIPSEAVQAQLDLNFTGAVELVRAALRYMEQGSKAIFISSACALFALPYRAYYCASKAAVNMAAFGLYMELKDKGIRVSTICPGDIKTDFTKNRVKYSEGGERYGNGPERSAQRIDGRENKRMELAPAAKKIYKKCTSCKKPLYIIGFKYKALDLMQRVLPRRSFLAVTAKMFAQKDNDRQGTEG